MCLFSAGVCGREEQDGLLSVYFLQECVEGKNKMVYYIKLHAPWDVCCFYAEDLSMRAPLQVR